MIYLQFIASVLTVYLAWTKRPPCRITVSSCAHEVEVPPVRPAQKQLSQMQVQSERAQALRRRRRKNWTIFLLFAGTNIALIIIFIYTPLVANIRYATLNCRLGAQTRLHSLANAATCAYIVMALSLDDF